MTSAYHFQPAAGAKRATVRIARAGLLACALAWLGLGAAYAQHGRGPYRGDPQQDQQGQQGPRGDYYPAPQRDEGARPERRFDPRSFDSHEFDDVRARRRQQQDEGNGEPMRRPRLTPDERRDLRRQINEAGSELYPHPPRR